MREARAAAIGLGAIAAVTFALAAVLVFKSVALRPHSTTLATDPIVQAFAEASTHDGRDVKGIDGLLPAGTPRTRVLEHLAADGFACTFEYQAATCFRSVEARRGTDIWTLWLTFDNAETLTSSQGERRTARR